MSLPSIAAKFETSQKSVFVWILIAITVCLLTWGNYRFAVQNPGGSDFLPGWVAIRSWLTEGLDPYGATVQDKIQELFYGSAQSQGDKILFVYPLFSAVVFFPFAMIPDFALARAFWMTFLELALIGSVIILINLIPNRLPGLARVLLILFSIIGYFGVRAIINSNIIPIVTLIVLLAFLMISQEKDIAAGGLLALSTIKPNVVILVYLFVVLWSLRRRRYKIPAAMGFAQIVLILVPWLLQPGWIQQNITKLGQYGRYPTPGFPAEVFGLWFPTWDALFTVFFGVVLGIVLFFEWRRCKTDSMDHFLWAACLTLLINQWIGIRTDPGNFVILMIPYILGFVWMYQKWGLKIHPFIVAAVLILEIGMWVLFITTMTDGAQPTQNPIMFFPLPLFLYTSLYIVRSWTQRESFLQTGAASWRLDGGSAVGR